MPPNRAYWCKYLADWVSVKKKWGLAMDIKEVDAIKKGRPRIHPTGKASNHPDGLS